MTSLQRLRKLHLFNRISLLCTKSNSTSSKSNLHPNGPHPNLQFFRFSRTDSNGGNISEKRYLEVRREAQAVLLEYFHETRNLPFTDAENLSKNSPAFLDRLLKRVLINGDNGDFRRLLKRHLRYHHVNEFEPFFESIGLNPCEYASFLPRDLDFLSGDQLLLQNYYILCNYGIERSRIGKIYVEAKEVFSYDHGILQSRLQSLKNLGLPQYLVVEIIALSPHILREDDKCNQELHDFFEKFKNLGIDLDWLVDHIMGYDSCDWKCMLEVMCLLGELGLTEEQSRDVILNHPHLLLERSGSCTLCLFSVLLKFGLTQSGIQAVFEQFPQVLSVASFIRNLLNNYQFLVGIKMPSHDIGRLVRLHPLLLGTCRLKKVSSLLQRLNCSVNRICKMVEEDPYVLKKWVRGVRVDRPPEPSRSCRARTMKTRFLESLGFVEESKEMDKALRLLWGKGDELQERFDCIVKSGLSRENAVAMVKSDPRVLNMSKDVIERKIDVLVRDLGYPVSIILVHPILFSYNTKRLKLRLSMHKWLKDEGVTKVGSCLRTLMKHSEEYFLRHYVNSHPQGARVWERMKKEMDMSSELP